MNAQVGSVAVVARALMALVARDTAFPDTGKATGIAIVDASGIAQASDAEVAAGSKSVDAAVFVG